MKPNRVITGLLVDYGFDFTDPKIYNGAVIQYETCQINMLRITACYLFYF
jgi:hypothetical protein